MRADRLSFKLSPFEASLIGLSGILRIWIAPYLSFGQDQIRILESGLRFYESGALPATGAKIVYTGTALPGGMQSLLTALPLVFSGGSLLAPAYFVAVLNTLAFLGIYFIYRRFFSETSKFLLLGVILFSPWSFLFSSIWNPAYIPFFCVLFLFGLFLLEARNSNFWPSFLLSLSFFALLQIHLSFVLLPIFFGVLWWSKKFSFPKSILGLFAGALIGGATLFPYLRQLAGSQEVEPEGTGSFLWSNILPHFENIFYWPQFFLRYLSFSTSEITRFIGTHRGFGGFLEFLENHPVWIAPSFFSLLVSIVIIGVGVFFYFSPSVWSRVFRKNSNSLEVLTVLVPPLTAICYLFSITKPSAHAFWILVPFSFYPIVLFLSRRKWDRLDTGKKKAFWAIYFFISVCFSFGSTMQSEHYRLLDLDQDIRQYEQLLSEGNVPENYWERIPKDHQTNAQEIAELRLKLQKR